MFYQKNIEKLKQVDAKLAAFISKYVAKKERIPEEPSVRVDNNTLFIDETPFGEYNDPKKIDFAEKECLRYLTITNLETKEDTKYYKKRINDKYPINLPYYLVLGFATGTHIRGLMQGAPKNSRVIVYEPSLEVFVAALKHTDLSWFFDYPQLKFICGGKGEMVTTHFRVEADATFMPYIEAFTVENLEKIPFYKERNDEVLEGIKVLCVELLANMSTLFSFNEDVLNNSFKNFYHIMKAGRAQDLFNKYRSKPAIVIGAGASLDKYINDLHKFKGKAVVIATDTACKPLQKAGFEPDFVCTGDPQHKNYLHIKGVDFPNTILVSEPQAYPDSYKTWTGQTAIGEFGEGTSKLITSLVGELGYFRVWGSVSVLCYDFAVKLGCDPIIFIGQDLSYVNDQKYVTGTYFETDEKKPNKITEEDKKGLVKVKDINGDYVWTNKQMYAYANKLNEFVKEDLLRRKLTVYNAGEHGILKGENIKTISFQEACDICSKHEFKIDDIPAKGKSRISSIIIKLSTYIREVKEIRDRCFRTRNTCVDMMIETWEEEPDLRKLERMLQSVKGEWRHMNASYKFSSISNQIAHVGNWLIGKQIKKALNWGKRDLMFYMLLAEGYLTVYMQLHALFNKLYVRLKYAYRVAKIYERRNV